MFGISAGMYSKFDKNLSKSQCMYIAKIRFNVLFKIIFKVTLSKIDFSPTRQSCKSPRRVFKKKKRIEFAVLLLAIRQLSLYELSQISQGFAIVNVSGMRLELDLARIEERYPETIFADPG